MRVNSFYGFLWIVSVLLTVTHNGNAQGSTTRAIDKIEVSVELNNEPLENCFKSIERQTGLLFAFRPDQVDLYTTISIPKATRTVSATLDLALARTSLTYRQMNNSIAVFEKNETPSFIPSAAVVVPEKKAPALEIITGKVTDTDGVPIPDVNVQIEGVNAVTTDRYGVYTIQGTADDVLVFSYVGYKTAEAKVGGRKVVDISLEYNIPVLEGVEVNAGYWKVAGRHQTGNIARITSKDIENQPVSNPLLALQGKVPGVYIQQQTGVAGGGVSILIRGTNSLRADGNLPLYVIDGVPFPSASMSSAGDEIVVAGSTLGNISLADIESIEILKDGDATAVYGSRGANGVVLITTKTGQQYSGKKMQVNVNLRQGFGNVTRTMDLLNTQQWLEMRREAFKNDREAFPKLNIKPTVTNAPDLTVWDTARYTDWQKKLIGGTARITDARASLSGGDEHTQYHFSSGYYRESTVFPGDFAFSKRSAHFNFNHDTKNERLGFTLLASYSGTNNDLPKADPTAKAIELSPMAPRIYDEYGDFNWEEHKLDSNAQSLPKATWLNPFAQLKQTYSSRTASTVVNAMVKYNILEGLHIKGNVGYTNMQVEELQKNPISANNPSISVTGSSIFADNKVNTLIAEPQIEYTDTLFSHGILLVHAGTTFQQTITQAQTLRGMGYTQDALIEDVLSAPHVSILNDDELQYRYNAVFGRINFNWKEKYFVNLTCRRDGSSRFGPGKQFANFGAIGAAWIFTEESFLSDIFSFLGHGKIRASYGITGSDQIGDYQYLDAYSSTSGTYNGQKGMVPSRLYNPDYSWETNRKAEVAMEVGIVGNRVLLSTSYYDHRSSNQLVGIPLPVITGFPSIQYNLDTEVQNSGLEVMLNTVNVHRRNFEWTTYINGTVPRNRLDRFPNFNGSPFYGRYVIGKPLSVQQRFHYTGVDPETGIYTFQDLNEDGIISAPDDYQPLQNVTQHFFGGIQNSVRVKGWQLDFLFQFVKQTGVNYLEYFFNQPGSKLSNQPVEVMQRWQKPGDVTHIQRFTQRAQSTDPAVAAYVNARSNSDYALGDASFVRLKNVSLSWRLPPKWLESLRLQQGGIYVQGQNLLTFTRYLGFDPEIPATSRSVPPLRVVTAGVQVTF